MSKDKQEEELVPEEKVTALTYLPEFMALSGVVAAIAAIVGIALSNIQLTIPALVFSVISAAAFYLGKATVVAARAGALTAKVDKDRIVRKTQERVAEIERTHSGDTQTISDLRSELRTITSANTVLMNSFVRSHTAILSRIQSGLADADVTRFGVPKVESLDNLTARDAARRSDSIVKIATTVWEFNKRKLSGALERLDRDKTDEEQEYERRAHELVLVMEQMLRWTSEVHGWSSLKGDALHKSINDFRVGMFTAFLDRAEVEAVKPMLMRSLLRENSTQGSMQDIVQRLGYSFQKKFGAASTNELLLFSFCELPEEDEVEDELEVPTDE